MKERPILFSAPMVRAILEGRKTQTRRIVTRIPCQCGTWIPKEMCATTPEGFQVVGHSGRWWCECCTSEQDAIFCKYGSIGDRLWVKETHARIHDGLLQHLDPDPNSSHCRTVYRSDGEPVPSLRDYGVKWKGSIFMPRKFSRITLEIVSIRVERLLDISDADAIAEGVQPCGHDGFHTDQHTCAYQTLWEEINGEGSWNANPWVWVIGFKPVTAEGEAK